MTRWPFEDLAALYKETLADDDRCGAPVRSCPSTASGRHLQLV